VIHESLKSERAGGGEKKKKENYTRRTSTVIAPVFTVSSPMTLLVIARAMHPSFAIVDIVE